MTTTYDTDSNTQTAAAAWGSSPLGQPEREVRYGFAAPEPVTATEREATAKRVMLTAAAACGIAAGGLLGVMLYYTDSSQPAVVAPAPDHAVVVGASTAAPAPVAPAPPNAAPNPVVRVPERTVVRVPERVVVPPARGGQAGVGSPPAPGDTTVIVDIPVSLPPLPPGPAPDPEPPVPDPEPPVPPEDPPVLLAPMPDPGVEDPVPPPIHELPHAEGPLTLPPGAAPGLDTPDWSPDFGELSRP